jgi:hypothetical protein
MGRVRLKMRHHCLAKIQQVNAAIVGLDWDTSEMLFFLRDAAFGTDPNFGGSPNACHLITSLIKCTLVLTNFYFAFLLC